MNLLIYMKLFYLIILLLPYVLSFDCDDLIVYTRKFDCMVDIRFWDVCPHYGRHFVYGVNNCECTGDFLLLLDDNNDDCIEVHPGANGCKTRKDIEIRLEKCLYK